MNYLLLVVMLSSLCFLSFESLIIFRCADLPGHGRFILPICSSVQADSCKEELNCVALLLTNTGVEVLDVGLVTLCQLRCYPFRKGKAIQLAGCQLSRQPKRVRS